MKKTCECGKEMEKKKGEKDLTASPVSQEWWWECGDCNSKDAGGTLIFSLYGGKKDV